MNIRIFSLSLLVAGTLFANTFQSHAAGYTFTDLGSLGGTITIPTDINSSGQVVGRGWTTGDTASHAILWNSSIATDLTPGILGYSSLANDINNAGQVAGNSVVNWKAGSGNEWAWRASVWNGTSLTVLGILPDTTHTSANAINNLGQVAGSSIIDSFSGHHHATVWNGGIPTDLGIDSIAYSINDVGQVAGSRSINSPVGGNGTFATVWSGTAPTTLEILAGTIHSEAVGINNSGQVIGWSLTNNEYHATVWNGSVATDFGPNIRFAAINNSGVIVGGGPNGHATLWDGETILDLNNFLDSDRRSAGWVLNSANGINDNGWIVGTAANYSLGLTHAFLLTPVPEPGTYAMMLVGLGLLGFITRRKLQSKLS